MAEDRNDFIAAFTIGALAGIGATLLLAPRPRGPRKVLEEIEPALRRARKGSRRIGKEAREVTRELGKRGGRALDAAGDEMWRAARHKVRQARRALRKRR